MIPSIHLVGNLTGDVELRFSSAGKAVCRGRVACNDRRRQDDGTWVDGATTFLDLVVFGAKGEAAADQLTKGTTVILSGRLQMRSWTDANGNKRTSYEVLVDEIGVLCKPGAASRAPAQSVGSDPWASAAPPF